MAKFDVDTDDECCGLVGGEMTTPGCAGICGPSWDWKPDGGMASPSQTCRVLGTLDMNEFHTAREGTRGR